jgi:hypothetical protein
MKSSTKGVKRGRAETDDSNSSSVETDNDNTEDEDTSTHDHLIEQKHQQKPLHATGESKTIFSVLDGGNPNASLAIFQVLLEELKLIPAYFQDARILLDMQELEMHLHGCTLNGAKMRIKELKQGQHNQMLCKYRVPGSRGGHPKVVMELKHVAKYILAQKGEVADALRASLFSVATRILSGDRSVLPTVHAIIDTIRDETTVTSTTTVPNADNVSADQLLDAHRASHCTQSVSYQETIVSRSEEEDDDTLRVQITEGQVNFDLLEAFTRRVDQDLLATKESHDDDARFVYCIRVRGTNRVKIGFSKDPYQRLATLQTAHADLLDLELTKRTRNYRILERELHYKHRDKRIRGEWFAFADDVDLEL